MIYYFVSNEVQSQYSPTTAVWRLKLFLKDGFVDDPTSLSTAKSPLYYPSTVAGPVDMAWQDYNWAKQLVKRAYFFFFLQEVISNRPLISNSTWCASHVHRLFTEKRNSGGVAVRRGLGCHRY